MAVLTQFSQKRAVVTLLHPEEELWEGIGEAAEEQENTSGGGLDIYSDVEIFAAGKEGKAFFNGVHAKVVERKEDELILHFTHVSRSFQKFADTILEKKM